MKRSCCHHITWKGSHFHFLSIFLLLALTSAAQTAVSLPHLQTKGNTTQLIVNDQPFLILGGELGNSSASSRAFMQPVWTKLQAMHLNTVLMPVYWELIEPEENKFDFTMVDSLVSDAANNNLHLVLLWFGTWKNSMSVYVPEWMKKDTKRFKRTINKQGRSVEIISALSKEALGADCKAFAALMNHIKATDAGRQTVIMVQVENEVGLLSTAKETTSDALQLFNQQVPTALMQYLQSNHDRLVPELKDKWGRQGYKTKGTWQEVFGNNLATDEIFQAYYYALYVDKVAAAGKQAYNIPMYVNAALNRPGVPTGRLSKRRSITAGNGYLENGSPAY